MTVPAFSETVTVLDAPPRDKFGDPTGPPAERDISGCVAWPTSTAEQQNLSDTTSTHVDVLLPPGAVVKSTDKVRWRGDDYDVNGAPFDYTSPLTGTRAGVLIRLVRVTG